MTAISNELALKRPADITVNQPAPARVKRRHSAGDVAAMTVLRFAAVLFIVLGLFGFWLAATGNHL